MATGATEPDTTSMPSGQAERSELTSTELFWRDNQPYLMSKGYLLRPRYMPDWVPSWKSKGRDKWDCEDAIISLVRYNILPRNTRPEC